MFIPTPEQRNILLVFLLGTLTTTGQGSMELIYPLNLHRLGSALPLIGITVALTNLGQFLARVPGGAFYSFPRARRLNFSGQVVFGLSTIGMALSGAWLAQAVLGLLHGLAFGLVTTFLLATAIESSAGGRAMAATIAWYTAAVSTGYAIGAPLGAQSILQFGHAGAFVVSGAVNLLAAALSLLLATRFTASDSDRAAAGGPRIPGPRELVRLPAAIWLATLLGLYINFVNDANGAFFPIYAVGVGISLTFVGYLKSALSISATGIRFLAAAVLRFVNPSLVNHVCVVVLALTVLELGSTHNPAMLLVVFVVWGIARGLLRVTSAVAVAAERERSGTHVGLASGVYNAGLDLGSMLAPPVTGALAGVIGIPASFRVIAVVLPILYYLAFFAARFRRRVIERERRSTPTPVP